MDVGGKKGVGGEEAVFATQSWQLCNEEGTFTGVKGRVTVRIEEEGDMQELEMKQLFREIGKHTRSLLLLVMCRYVLTECLWL